MVEFVVYYVSLPIADEENEAQRSVFPLPHSKRQKKEASKLRPREVFIPE